MKFSSVSDSLGIVEDIDWLVDSNSTSYPVADKTRNINSGLDRVAGLILQADAKWEWDDTNQTDLPIGTTTLTSGQQDYGIDSTYVKIRKVAVKDTEGRLRYLEPMDENELRGLDLMDSNAPQGVPTKYALVGNSIVFDRKPNYTQSGGVKVWFQRSVSYFTAADTTKTPGFAPMFHRILSYYAARDYAWKHEFAAKKLDQLNERIKELEAGILDFYANRDDRMVGMALAEEDYGATHLLGQ